MFQEHIRGLRNAIEHQLYHLQLKRSSDLLLSLARLKEPVYQLWYEGKHPAAWDPTNGTAANIYR
ncbi:hypothetical protein [Stutzerimonas nitrititolerans]|uniref:hypothetical protein n=1 Tax=Stutzerimonas nitrititolerans TaxID=2482751 RepID=UPI00289A4117|nr:hypothetical protein [Stutzerimonas nitrititolerans]